MKLAHGLLLLALVPASLSAQPAGIPDAAQQLRSLGTINPAAGVIMGNEPTEGVSYVDQQPIALPSANATQSAVAPVSPAPARPSKAARAVARQKPFPAASAAPVPARAAPAKAAGKRSALEEVKRRRSGAPR